jgi:ADP-ribose pyrophosphatase
MKILNAAVITKLKFVTLFAVSYQDRKGNAKEWHMVSRQKQPKCITGKIQDPDAVIIVPYHREEEKLVVIREFRIPVGGYQYGFPAGLLDPGEDIAGTAARELLEETGLKLERVFRHSPAIFSSAGITDESIAMVLAEVSGTPSRRRNSASEEIDIELLDRSEVRQLLDRDNIVFGARAWLAMDAFVRMGEDYFRIP